MYSNLEAAIVSYVLVGIVRVIVVFVTVAVAIGAAVGRCYLLLFAAVGRCCWLLSVAAVGSVDELVLQLLMLLLV